MTVSTVVDHNDYTGNGVTTSFPYTFRIFKKTDLAVSVVDLDENITVLVLDTDYTVTNAGGYNGGNVVLTTPLANGWQISIARELEPTQETDLRNQGKFFAEVHEDAFDKLTMLIQQVGSMFRLALRKPSSIANWYDALNNYIRNLRDPRDPQDAATKNYVDSVASGNLSRTLRVPEPINQLPSAADRANKMPVFDSAGNAIVVLPPSGSATDVMIELAKPTGAGLVGAYDADGNTTTVQGELNNINSNFSETPKDYFIGSFFNSNSDVSLTLFKSFDGINFSVMNKSPLLTNTGSPVGNRDPSIVFYKGCWYVAVTGASADSDFHILKSYDLINWTDNLCKAGTGLWGKPGSTIGGTIPVISPIWAPSLFVDGGELYCQINVAYNPPAPDINGTNVNWMVPFSCRCNNINNLTFDSAVQMMSDTSVQRIDVEVSKITSGYAIVIKNEYNKHIEVWTSSTYIGGYTRIADLDFGGTPVEGPSLVWMNQTSKWRLYADAFNQNGVTWCTDSTNLTSWTSPVRVQSPGPMRHGTVYNIANSPEAKSAVASFVKASAIMDSDYVPPKWAEGGTITSGSQTIVPQCNYVYRVVGSIQATININEKGGDYFWLLVASGNAAAGITVAGSKVDGSFSIGFGQTNLRLYKLIYNTQSRFYQLQGTPNQNGDAATFNTQTGWPTISTTFIPVHNRTYTTNGAISATTITGLPSTPPDGTQFHMFIGSETTGGSIVINSNATNVEIGSSNITLAGNTGNGNKLYTFKKISGVWRLLAY
ncbi:hypothetical protein [Enterobacter cloacae]|uniref:hypothetical protein n=1 Tax=Enterobacter cloacae TaxID=550 RepID=UPI001F54BADF|nr:hypothetical protein [Enterobacter cloacae]